MTASPAKAPVGPQPPIPLAAGTPPSGSSLAGSSLAGSSLAGSMAGRATAAPAHPLRRPALLIRAARAGLPLYRRARDLRRLLGADTPPAPARALAALTALEAECEARRHDDPGYDAAQHVTVLIALLAEARLCPADPPVARLYALPTADSTPARRIAAA